MQKQTVRSNPLNLFKPSITHISYSPFLLRLCSFTAKKTRNVSTCYRETFKEFLISLCWYSCNCIISNATYGVSVFTSSTFPTLTVWLCLLQVRYCLKNLREQMAAKTKVAKFCCVLAFYFLPLILCFMAFPFTPIIIPAVVHSFPADFLLFFFQPHTNGWKVGIPFRKNGLSAPKTGSTTDGQVSRIKKCWPTLI